MNSSHHHKLVVRLLSLCLTLGLVLSTVGAHAAGYAKFDGVDGEATDKTHTKWSDILGFKQAQSASGGSTGRARGGSTFSDITVEKRIDAASVKLSEAAAKGTNFKKVTLHLTATEGGSRVTFYEVELTNVRITNYQFAASGNSVPVEEISLNFEKIKVTYTKYDGSGKKSGSVSYSFDVLAGK